MPLTRFWRAATLAVIGLLTTASAVAAPPAGQVPEPGYFKPSPDDFSVNMLREVFGPIIDSILGAPELGTPDTALAAGMAVFLAGVLFLGMIFVAFMTVKGVMDSAQDGEFLGRRMSSVWTPIRTVAGTGLLLPLGSGYCFLQLVILWVCLQSVGLANRVNEAVADSIAKHGSITAPVIEDSRALIGTIFLAEVCRAAQNAEYAARSEATRIELQISTASTSDDDGLRRRNFLWSTSPTAPPLCGEISFASNTEHSRLDDPVADLFGEAFGKIRAALAEAHESALQEAAFTLRTTAAAVVQGQSPGPGPLLGAARTYEARIRVAADAAIDTLDSYRAMADDRDTYQNDLGQKSWIFMGAYYNHLIAQQDAIQQAVNMLPSFQGPRLQEFDLYIDRYRDALAAATEMVQSANRRNADAEQSVRDEVGCAASPESFISTDAAINLIKSCISVPFVKMTKTMTHIIGGDNMSHVSQMKQVGDVLIYGAYVTTAVQGTAGAVIGTTQGTGLGFLQAFAAPFAIIFGYLWLAGGYLAVYLPMTPYMIWIGGCVKWLVAVLESVIAAPIWAAAHIHPDGDDQVGRAGPGYMLILGVFLRPVLMVFGFIAAIILAHPVASFINHTYMTSAIGAAGTSLYGPVYFMGYTGVYILAMTVMLHTIFGLINYVPDQVLRWIGGSMGISNIGDEQGEANKLFLNAAAGVRGKTPQATNPKTKTPEQPKDGGGPSANDNGGGTPKRSTPTNQDMS